MKPRKRILALVTGIITALLLLAFTYRDFVGETSFSEKQKPKQNAPALNGSFFVDLFS